MSSTTTRISTQAVIPLYADPAGTMGGGTPLILAVSKTSGQDDVRVLIKLRVLQAYDQMIFELQQQLLRYKAIVDQLAAPTASAPEELNLQFKPFNSASVRLLDSIVRAAPTSQILRGSEELDD